MTDPLVVSYSELASYRQCPLKHQFEYKMRYRRPQDEGSALNRGSLWHEALEIHYETLLDLGQNEEGLREARERVLRSLQDPKTGESTPDQSLIRWMYLGHVERYGFEPQWKILAIEQPFLMELVPATDEHPAIKIKGKMDLLVEDADGWVWVVDHKSGAELPYRTELDLDDQFGLYIEAARRAGMKVHGSIHSAARTRQLKGDVTGNDPTPLDKRFLRTSMSRTPLELQNLWADAARAAVAAWRNIEPPYSSPTPRDCKWKCDFFEVHMIARKGVALEAAMRSFGFEHDPTRH